MIYVKRLASDIASANCWFFVACCNCRMVLLAKALQAIKRRVRLASTFDRNAVMDVNCRLDATLFQTELNSGSRLRFNLERRTQLFVSYNLFLILSTH